MKNTLFIAIILVYSIGSAFAQSNQFLTAFNNVNEYVAGERQNSDLIIQALEAINQTTKNEKMMLKGKTWYYKGIINQLIFESEELSSQHPKALFESSAGYQKALSIEDSKFKFQKESVQNIANVAIQLYNKGVELYSMGDYDGAYDHFMEVKAIKEFLDGKEIENNVDVDNALFNAALSAYKMDKKEESMTILEQLIEMEYDNAAIYQVMASYQKEDGDNAAAMEVLEKGLARYPENLNLLIDQLNIYLAEDRATEAIEKMEQAIQLDPTNAQLYFALANTYEKTENRDKAEESYKKAIELDPEYVDAYNNLGALYFHEAEEVNQEIEGVTGFSKADIAKVEKLEEKRNAIYLEAVPHLEKASEIDPSRKDILLALKKIYAKTGKLDEAKAVKAKIDKLDAQ